MTALLDLPQELVATIYSRLPDRASKQAFFSSCSAVRRNTSVLALLTRLSISRDQLHSAISPLACLPRGVKLQSLTIEGSDWAPCVDDAAALLNLFRTREDASRARVQSVIQRLRELRLIGCIILSSSLASALGRVLGSLPLAPLVVISCKNVSPSFFKGLSAAHPAALKTLHWPVHYPQYSHIDAISQLTGLQALLLKSSRHLQLSPLGSLRHLKELSLSEDLLGSPADTSWLTMLQYLEVLRLDVMPVGAMLQMLPPSLQILSIKKADVGSLSVLAGMAANLPRLQRLELSSLHRGNSTWGALGPALSAMLSSHPQLHIVTAGVYVMSELDAFMEACQPVPAFAMGVEGLVIEGHLQGFQLKTDTCLRLSAMCENLERLMFVGFDVDDIADLSRGLKHFGRSLQYVVFFYEARPSALAGVGSVLFPLIFETALSSKPFCFLLFQVLARLPPDEDDAALTQADLDTIKLGMDVASRTLRRLLGSSRAVYLDAKAQ